MEAPDIHLSFQKKRIRDLSLRNPPAPSSIFLPSNIQKLRNSSVLKSRDKSIVQQVNDQNYNYFEDHPDHQQQQLMSHQKQQCNRASFFDNSSNITTENGRRKSIPFYEYLQNLTERRQQELNQQKHQKKSRISSKKKEGMFGILDEGGVETQNCRQSRCFSGLDSSLQSSDLWQNLEIVEKQCREQRKKSAGNKYYAFYIEKLRKEQQIKRNIELFQTELSPAKKTTDYSYQTNNRQNLHLQQYIKNLRNERNTPFPDNSVNQIDEEKQQSLIELGLKEARERLPLIPQRPSRIVNYSNSITRKNSLSQQNEFY